jgi:xanthine dehydrogenase molybdopterin-binding subunit B
VSGQAQYTDDVPLPFQGFHRSTVLTVSAPHCLALQVSGQAQYTDDVPLPPNTLHAAFVTSSKPHAKLLKVRPVQQQQQQQRG